MAIAYLGLGGNLGDPVDNLRSALLKLNSTASITVKSVSRFYQTEPVGGPPNQPSYVNAVVAIESCVGPRELLQICLSVEAGLGRIRSERWGSRTIDIDILLFNSAVIDEPGLTVPHPMLRQRLFALLPLADVASTTLELPPDNVTLGDLLDSIEKDPDFDNQRPLFILDNDIELTEFVTEIKRKMKY